MNKKTASSLADPEEYENLFPDWRDSLKTEQYLKPQRQRVIPAGRFPQVPVSILYYVYQGGWIMKTEQYLKPQRQRVIPAGRFPQVPVSVLYMYIMVVRLWRLTEDRAISKAAETEGHTRGQVSPGPCEYIVYVYSGGRIRETR